jgi:hypothetical protein
MKKCLSLALKIPFLLILNGFALGSYWDFASADSRWTTNAPLFFRQSDTSFTDARNVPVSGVYRFGSVVGTSGYASYDLRQDGVYMAGSPRFDFTATLYLSRIDLYSMIFLGIGDSQKATPFDYSGNTGIMVGIGKTYDGCVFGIYADNGANYLFKDTVNDTLLTENTVYYILVDASSGSSLQASLYRMSDDRRIASVTLPYNYSSYANRGLNYWTITNKGYQSSNGTGYATILGGMDALSFDYGITTSFQKNSLPQAVPDIGIQAFPNPFVDKVNIVVRAAPQFSAKPCIAVYDSQGRRVASLAAASSTENNVTAIWDARECRSGVYFIRAVASGKTLTKAIYLIK